jgi:hypothetical protein
MANLLGDVLFAIVRVVIWRWAGALVLSVLTWLDTKIPGRRMKIVAGGALGLAAYILVPVFAGLVGF